MKTVAHHLPQHKPWPRRVGWLIMLAGGAAAILAANAVLCRAARATATQPTGKVAMNPAAMSLLAKARHELTAGEWAESLRNFQRYLTDQPADNAAMLEYLSLSRQQHKSGAALQMLAGAAADGAMAPDLVRSDWHVLIGPYPSRSELDTLVRTTADRHNGLPTMAAVGKKRIDSTLNRRKRAWRYFLLALGSRAAGDPLAATGFGYAAANLDSQLPGVQKFIASELFFRHDFAAADQELHAGIRHLNHHPDRLAMQVAMDMAQDRTDSALRLALAYQRMHRHQMLGYWLLARVYRARGQRRREIHELLTLLNIFPGFAPAYRSLLRIAKDQNNTALTQRLEHIYALNFPVDPRSAIFAANHARFAGNNILADKLLRSAAQRNPRNKRIALALWKFDFARHQFKRSLQDIHAALLQRPDNPTFMAALLQSLLANGHPHKALAGVRASAQRELRSKSRQAMYVNLLLQLHQAKTAGDWLAELNAALPHRNWVKRLDAHFLEAVNKPKQALAVLQALAYVPVPRIMDIQALADLTYEQGDTTTYVTQMKRILAIEPTSAEANNDLAYFWAQRRKHLTKSLGMANLAVREYPRDTASRDTLGWIYYRLGRFHRALEQFRIAVMLPGGENASEFLHLGDTLHKLSQNSFALHSWEHGLKLLPAATALSRHEQELRARLLKRIAREKRYQSLDTLHGGQGL